MRRLLCACLCMWLPAAAAQESYSFNVSEFQKKPLELSGYAELLGQSDRKSVV